MTSRLTSLRGSLPLILVIAALIASVVVPARQSWRILELLRATTESLAPAKVVTAEIQAGLLDELSVLRGDFRPGPQSVGDRYRLIAQANAARLDSLRHIAPRLDAASARAIDDVVRQVTEWRAVAGTPAGLRNAGFASDERLHAAALRHDSAMRSLATLSASLTVATGARDERVRRLERLSFFWNLVLVTGALVALSAVVVLTMRERRALTDAERRSRRESALREAAEALAGAYTIPEAMQRITDSACRIVDGRAAFIEEPAPGLPGTATISASQGEGAPASGSVRPLAGSWVEAITNAGQPTILEAASRIDPPAENAGPVLGIPLGSAQQSLGVLLILGDARRRFLPDDLGHARTLGHLASLALQKVRVLEDARQGREKLERVLASRSRLIRGFSHDVKNPIGAADGFAALLGDGIYGELRPEQHESVQRLRRSLHSALSLIEDLHDLARAETGHLTVTREPVDVNRLLAGLIDEYQAAARAGGLTLTARLDEHLTPVFTSEVRLHQILSNLLSNAIKYTARGSVVVESRMVAADPAGAAGPWLQVHVADTGPGIPRDRQEFIFEEFSRIGTREKPGAGLGLAISRLLAGALGGYITVESEVGSGARFILWLPAE